jgi:hypothetical protein
MSSPLGDWRSSANASPRNIQLSGILEFLIDNGAGAFILVIAVGPVMAKTPRCGSRPWCAPRELSVRAQKISHCDPLSKLHSTVGIEDLSQFLTWSSRVRRISRRVSWGLADIENPSREVVGFGQFPSSMITSKETTRETLLNDQPGRSGHIEQGVFP